MRSILKILYLPVINVICIIGIGLYYHSYELWLFIFFLLFVLLSKNQLEKKARNVWMDLSFLFSFLVLFSPDHFIWNLIVLTVIVTIYWFLPSFSILFEIPLHNYVFIIILIISSFLKQNIILLNESPFLMLSLLPLYWFYFESFLLFLLFFFFMGGLLLGVFPGVTQFFLWTQITGVYAYIFAIPFRIRKYKKIEIILYMILFLFSFFCLYTLLSYREEWLSLSLLLLCFLILEFLFNFIKNRLLNR